MRFLKEIKGYVEEAEKELEWLAWLKDLTKRMQENEKKQFESKLASLTHIEDNVNSLRLAVNTIKWESNSNINHPNMPYYAFIAVHHKKISKEEFVDLMLYWSTARVYTSHKIKSYHFGFNPITALPLLEKVLVSPIGLYLNEDQFAEFLTEMSKRPLADQQFFVAPHSSEDRDVVNRLNELGFGFCQIDKSLRMIFSFGMREVYLKIKYRNPMQLNPVFGLSSLDDLKENAFTDKRDMALDSPDAPLPKQADGFTAEGPAFSHHDTYHAALAACLTSEERRLMIDTANAVWKDLTESPAEITQQLEPAIHFIVNQLVDMEFSPYRPDLAYKKLDPANKYWATIALIFVKYRTFESLPTLSKQTQLTILTRIFSIAEKKEGYTNPLRSDFVEIKSLFTTDSKEFARETKLAEAKGRLPDHMLDAFGISTMLDEIARIWRSVNIIDFLKQEIQPLYRKPTPTQTIKQKITEFIEPSLTLENIVSVFLYACEQKFRELQQTCLIFMAKNLNNLIDHPSFKDLQTKRPTLVAGFLKSLRQSRFFQIAFKAALCAPAPCPALALLLPSAEQVNQLDVFGFTALDYAIQCGHTNIVKQLIQLGAKLNPQPDSKAMPTLFAAMHYSNAGIFKLLFDSGFDLSTKYQGHNWLSYYEYLVKNPETCGGFLSNKKGIFSLNPAESKLYTQAVEIATAEDPVDQKPEKFLENSEIQLIKAKTEAERNQILCGCITRTMWGTQRLESTADGSTLVSRYDRFL